MVFFIFLVPLKGYLQPIKESVNYINYSIKDGLPSSETYDVYQDSKGYIWIGTDNGVVKYDGATFKTYTTLDGLTDNTIFKIQEDEDGRIWFVTYNRKLCYFENGEFKQYAYNDKIKLLIEDVYVGSNITNFNISKKNLEFSTVRSIAHDNVDYYISDSGKTLIKSSEKKASIFYNCQSAISRIDLFSYIKHLLNQENPDIKLIVETSNFGRIHAYQRDSTLIMTSKNGVHFYDMESGRIIKNILPKFFITGFYVDFEGGYWCSSLFNGIFYIPNPNLKQFRTGDFFSTGHNDGIIPQGNELFFSYNFSDDIYKANIDTNLLFSSDLTLEIDSIPNEFLYRGIKFENPVNFNNVYPAVISALRIDSNKILIASSHQKLMMIENNGGLVLNTAIRKFTTDHEGIIWGQNEFGVLRKAKTLDKFYVNRFLPKFAPKVLKIFRDSEHIIWLASTEGLFTFDIITELVDNITKFPSFQGKRIQDIIESKDGTMFFATKASGVYIESQGLISHLGSTEGLLSNTINQLLFDSVNNQVWVATSNGISIIEKDVLGEWITSSVITKFEGLESTNIRQIFLDSSYLYFTNNIGVSRIKKNELKHPRTKPFLYLSNLIVNDSIITDFQNLNFHYDSNNIQINYQAIGYKSQNNFTYWYRINDAQDNWQSTTNPNIVLASLPPGDYHIQIKATNVDGVESETKSISFNIVPAFWMTNWFKFSALIVALFIGYRASINTIRVYRNQAKFQKKVNELQVASLQSKMSPHFIFNSLNSIQNYILKNEPEQANEYLLEFSKLIRIILQNSDSTNILLNKEIKILEMYVELERKRLRSDFKFTVEYESEVDHNCVIPSLLIQPYVENSIWHGKVYSNPNGEIKIMIKRINNFLFFEITDNGIGIKNAQSSKIYPVDTSHESVGTSITKKRIQLLSELHDQMSEVEISDLNPNLSSNKFVGTCVRFSIPYEVKSTI